ncbi:homogentisate 1,2-dioxygenase [Streptomyces sp. NA02950]|uniref:homogentisate 1,2-dioxygenase n=1 Tax=Streptomyces sp. NA02950 TaxID=2742137 RepID=UPI00158FECD1|nr:homogentisate 1,2-dioxygenase domain-containing protein [Streptomyces sp. NA02950]QKV97084.1 homogentisate 1,2-dioxygenase [Streptomyces sp. NA02950]
MAYYRQAGDVPPKRHTQHRDRHGALYYEELMGEEGFASDSSLLYHRHIPSAITSATPWQLHDQSLRPNHPLLPRHVRLHDLFGVQWTSSDPVTARRLVVGNPDVRISYVVAGRPSPLYRNALGDECVYIESGAAVVETVFGSLQARQGDYVLIPRATTHRWLPAPGQPLRAYAIEAASHILPARRYLSKHGQLLEHAPFCERDLRGPEGPLLTDGADVEVLVKHRGPEGVTGTRYAYRHHPFDVVGWDGCLYPYTFNIEDFEPITGRIHQPPPAHQVFEGENFVICNFVPRKVDYHPRAIPVPYYHSNVDSDEVMFYCGGDYEARSGSGVGQGSLSLHPGGHAHGPQPGSYERSIGAEFFNELAVMVDTFRPLELGAAVFSSEDPDYAWSWVTEEASS